ncbi:metal ABC transporter solute-binding protein, Zn/Mn family [Zafaria sp. J156]|uniref:metal ABC transporter solute-binding protein, Zn/Mn family n=1 Tax=Zafaria sp. J156 TaxID=3116490 RepID=UPI002E7873A1|nr:zinc ABC transporter substrate-binding protein [Zafaria sp. J156]MEE1622198.1 zinc ABC transporter substrate-binding protein [Zafaria sp. J156]
MRRTALPLALAALLAATGCASGAAAPDPEADGPRIVASTSVYGDIARTVGGDAVEVESIIDRIAQDPHSYEATAQDKLALSKADLVVANGGGYDAFADVLINDLGLEEEQVLRAVDFSEAAHAEEDGDHDHEGEGHGDEEHAEEDGHVHAAYNEHVWYDVHTVVALAHAVAERLAALVPDEAESFRANATAFEESLAPVEAKLTELSAAADGRAFAMTEPVPYYLLVEAGLRDATPEGYSAAIEHGEDVSPLLQRHMLDVLEDGTVAVLAYNEQTSSAQTEAVRQAAERAGVPVVEFTETIPDSEDFASWMTGNIEALEAALAG